MGMTSAAEQQQLDEHFLRRCFDVARRSLAHGNHPFAAILVDAQQQVLVEVENGYMPSRDGTAHAERLLATKACTTLPPDVRAKATLYSSAEPCAMCAGAIYWAGIGRVVYALPEEALLELTAGSEENPTLDLPCREVFARGTRTVVVAGPAIEDEARVVHAGFWG